MSLIFQYSDCSLLKNSEQNIPHESYSEQLKNDKRLYCFNLCSLQKRIVSGFCGKYCAIQKCGIIYYGAHADDSAGNAYPDCSEAFNNAMNTAIYEGSGRRLEISAPFVGMSKAEVVKLGLSLDVPYELTWSCYEGGTGHAENAELVLTEQRRSKLNGIKDPAER